MMKYAFLAASLLSASPAASQSWGDLNGLIVNQLTGQELHTAAFMPDSTDPLLATQAIAIAHTVIPDAAGNTAIHVGHFLKHGDGWRLARRIEGIYGYGNENPAFNGTFFEVTTQTLGPNDPRCCPTQKTRWRVDLTTGQVVVRN